jgi:NTE family protein
MVHPAFTLLDGRSNRRAPSWRRIGVTREGTAMQMREERRVGMPGGIGLVLGGGGGRGGAHLGVLDALVGLRLPIDLIVGTSIGGVVGVCFAAGLGIDDTALLLDGRSLWDIAERDRRRLGLLGNRRLRAILERALGGRTFADLAIPCAVVAADLVRGRQVIIDRGPLVEALLATTALPGLFPPVEREGMLLADGGVVNNLPVDIALARGVGRTVAVDLGAGDADFSPPGLRRLAGRWPDLRPDVPLAIAHRALMVLIAQLTRYHLAEAPPDVLLQPDVRTIGTLDMGHIAVGRAAGRAAAEAAREALLALRDWRVGDGAVALPAAGTAR